MHSLSTEIDPIYLLAAAAVACVIAVAALFWVYRAFAYVRSIADWVGSEWQQQYHDSKVGDLERRVTELEDTSASHAASLSRLRSKYAMRDLRERKQEKESASEFDDGEKAAYKSRLRLHAKKSGLLR